MALFTVFVDMKEKNFFLNKMEYFHFVIHNWIYLFSCRSYMDNDGDENKMAIFMIEI